MDKLDAVKFLVTNPYKLGHLLGFTKLTDLHNNWIVDMILGNEDKTLQAHRGSYKTTCVSIALAIIIILLPNKKIMFMRKTDNDIKEIISQVKKILQSQHVQYFVNCIYNVNLKITTSTYNEINTNLCNDIKGTSQLIGLGMGSSLTGKHFDKIFTDDIVNVNDRISKAERDKTKLIYQELRNIINRGGRIYNTGTPWHKDDAFSLMPNPEKWDCYSTGLIEQNEIEEIKNKMTASLFSANYELRHIASDDIIFKDPQRYEDNSIIEQGECHIDAAYGGEDNSVFTICKKINGKYYVFGKMWKKHIDDCLNEIIELRQFYNAGKIWCEDNGDKGYLAKELKRKGERAVTYHENQNKFLKITSYLKFAWQDVFFVSGTDKEYIQQILDYNENAEHDDAPDSLASIVRKQWKNSNSPNNEYHSIFE